MDEDGCKTQFSVDVPDYEREELLEEDEEDAVSSLTETTTPAASRALVPNSNVLFEIADLSFTDISWDAVSQLDNTVNASSTVKQELQDSFSNDSGHFMKDSLGVISAPLNSPIKPKSILKKPKGTVLDYAVAAIDLTFPSKAFIKGCGMSFCSSFSEIQREVALLSWKLSPELKRIDSEILELANYSPKLSELLRRHFEGKTLDHLVAKELGFTDEDINLFKTLTKTFGNLRSEGGRLYLGKKLLLYQVDHCKLFQVFTRRFALRSIKPLLELLEEHYVFSSKPTTSHSQCGCLSNPLMKLPQVLQNLPLKLLAPYYCLRHSLATPHGTALQKLAVLGRGRRPWRVVIILDQLLYPELDMTSFMSVQCEILIQEKLDLVSARTAIEQHPRYATDSVLFVVMTSFGSLIQGSMDRVEEQTSGPGGCTRARFERCSLQPKDGGEQALLEDEEPIEESVEHMDADDIAEKGEDSAAESLGKALADHVIQSALTLWRSVLCNTRDSDVAFVALPALVACGTRGPKLLCRHSTSLLQPCAKQHSGPSCRAVLLRACALYSRWCYLQNFSTGRLRDLGLLTASHLSLLYQPSVADLTFYVTSLVNTVRKDASLEQNMHCRNPHATHFVIGGDLSLGA
ncbi:hypothetical protein FHG87_006442 [Trinorchestia longiramus]|nr:hypothetical protein FHG87_006442 [Trinorchestia longiramus]